jgi:hypothetical protein
VQEAARTYGTQDSTTQTPFPKVKALLPNYFLEYSSESKSSIDSEEGSSGEEWLGTLGGDDDETVQGPIGSDSDEDWDGLVEDTFCDETEDQT